MGVPMRDQRLVKSLESLVLLLSSSRGKEAKGMNGGTNERPALAAEGRKQKEMNGGTNERPALAPGHGCKAVRQSLMPTKAALAGHPWMDGKADPQCTSS
eukprot:1157308-Pelagomonas_calceolata.AAC.14